MAYFNICEHCGCSLDPGESCDCHITGYKPQIPKPKKKSTQQRKKKEKTA